MSTGSCKFYPFQMSAICSRMVLIVKLAGRFVAAMMLE